MGSTWGVTYNREAKMVYFGASLKRHAGLHEPFSAGGIDAIYAVDPFAASPNASLFLQLDDDLGIAADGGASLTVATNASRGLPSTSPYLSVDASVLGQVGKVGIGGLAMSDDMQTLYVMNLYDKTVYAIDVNNPTAANPPSYTFTLGTACDQGEFRPWALTYHKGKLYAGGVCDASSAGADPLDIFDTTGKDKLEGIVFELIGTSFSEIYRTGLDYEKQRAAEHGSNECRAASGWFPWTDVEAAGCRVDNITGGTRAKISYPQPILSDLAFDTDGSLILGFLDRAGLQYGARQPYAGALYTEQQLRAGGDIRRVCYDAVTGTYMDEDPSSPCNTNTSYNSTADDWSFPLTVNEYYFGDYFTAKVAGPGTGAGAIGHPEVCLGGLTVIPGLDEVAMTAYDPRSLANNYEEQGALFLDINGGQQSRVEGFEITGGSSAPLYGKGMGLGDLEALCEAAPMEIGNYVWFDTNEDGIQDAGESAISGVTVELYDATGTLLASTMTDADGHYAFSQDGAANQTWVNANDGVEANTTYYVVLGNGETTSGIMTIGGNNYEPTAVNNDASANGTIRDSDGEIIASSPANAFDNLAAAQITTGDIGYGNHSLDFGFIPAILPPPDHDGDGIADADDLDDDNDGIPDVEECGTINIATYDSGSGGATDTDAPTGGQIISGGATANLTLSTVGGVFMNAFSNRWRFNESTGAEGATYTMASDIPLKEPILHFDNIGWSAMPSFGRILVGDFILVLDDGTVMNNVDFIIDPTFGYFYSTPQAADQETIVKVTQGGIHYISDPANTGDSNQQAYGEVEFIGIPEGRGVSSITFTALNRGIGPSLFVGLRSRICQDFDGDGLENCIDLDSDGDGIVDIIEAGGIDNNGDGLVDDINPDGTLVNDADNDGLDDARDDQDSGISGTEVTSGTPWPLTNTDGNGNPNYLDIDADDDGITDNVEGQSTAGFDAAMNDDGTGGFVAPTGMDDDGDGIDNAYDNDPANFGGSGVDSDVTLGSPIPPHDYDGDGTPDYLDLDSDEDGSPDRLEGHDGNQDGSVTDDLTACTPAVDFSVPVADADGDGLLDCYDAPVPTPDVTQVGAGSANCPDPTDANCTPEDPSPGDNDAQPDFRDNITDLLPLELISFSVDCITEFKNRVTWVTANEQNIRSFVIERALLGTDDWVQLATEQPRGSQDRQALYTFIDSYTIGEAYYRLRIVENDGSYTFSNVIVTDCAPATFNIPHIYPNPTVGDLTIIYESVDGKPIQFELVDVLGRILMTEELLPTVGLNVKQIDVAELSAGNYFIRLNNGKNQVVEKVVKY